MKFLVFALVALSACLSESEGERRFPSPFVPILKEYYGMTLKQFKAKCVAKNKAYWDDIVSVVELGSHIGEDLINDVAKRAADSDGSDETYDAIIEDRCLDNVVLEGVRQFTFATIAQCLEPREIPKKAKRAAIIKAGMLKTCIPVKEIAKERNSHSC